MPETFNYTLSRWHLGVNTMKLNTLQKLFRIFTANERKNALILLLLSTTTAFLQALGVFSIFPFIDVLMNPAIIQSNRYYNAIYTGFNFTSTNDFLMFIGIVVFIILVTSNMLSAMTLWFKTRFVFLRNHAMSRRLLKIYLNHDYDFYLTRNTSELSKNILQEVNHLTQHYLMSIFEIITNGLILLFIIITIMIIEPVITLIVIVFFGIIYLVINHYIKNALKKRGEQRFEVNEARFRMAHEALASIKTTKVFGVENFFLHRYSQNSRLFARYNAYSKVASIMPKFIIEATAFGALVLFILVQLALGNDITHIIPLITLLAFAGYRLLPATQKVFASAAELHYNRPILEKIFYDMQESTSDHQSTIQPKAPLSFNQAIELKDLSFAYGDDNQCVLNNVNLIFPKGAMIGFVGESGSGKTTLIDLVMGLLKPTSGAIVIDDITLNHANTRAWQLNIGYVPQDIYLSDDSIANNIAFGIGKEDIDMARVMTAAKLSAIDTFIETQLPKQYHTVVGERGVRLSGGQRQRIGLARALYKNPDILVLDEATSALDHDTEQLIIDALESAAKNRTVFMVAHRRTTLKKCDVIYEVSQHKIVKLHQS